MKTLKFAPELVPLVLSGEKTATWRLFDDKNLDVGDTLQFIDSAVGRHFAKAVITEVAEKKLGELTEQDWEGHERFATKEDMYATYQKYYNQPVDSNTLVKMVRFKLTQEAAI